MGERTHSLPDGCVISRDQAPAWVLWNTGRETGRGSEPGNRGQSRDSGLRAVVHGAAPLECRNPVLRPPAFSSRTKGRRSRPATASD